MTTGHTPNAIGKDTEQKVARWMRDHGFPHCERTVRTGYRTANRQLVDAGDLDGIPGVVTQIKSMRPAERAERLVPTWMAETEVQRAAVGADVGLLIVRRWGTTDVGRWWAFLPASDFIASAGGEVPAVEEGVVVPVRVELAHAAMLLRAWGHGDPLEGNR